MDKAAAAETESAIRGDDDEEAAVANDIASITSDSQACAAVWPTIEAPHSADPGG